MKKLETFMMERNSTFDVSKEYQRYSNGIKEFLIVAQKENPEEFWRLVELCNESTKELFKDIFYEVSYY